MKFIVYNVYPDICELSGHIKFKVMIHTTSSFKNTSDIYDTLYNTYEFDNDSRLMLLKDLTFEVKHPTEKKIVDILIDHLTKVLCEHNRKYQITTTCPICNNENFIYNHHHCVSIDCVCNNLEKTIYEKINIIYGDIFDYELFKLCIYRNAVSVSLSKIDLFHIFHSLYHLSDDYFQMLSKENSDKIKRLLDNFFNMNVSTFLKLCKCPFEFRDIISNIDISIPSLDNFYMLLSINDNTTSFNNIPALHYMIKDSSVVNYIFVTFRVNAYFLSKYMEFKSKLMIME